ncbi:MAG: DUF1592 domain-containing protein [Alphaproteobacteria bacterium]|nr:DUF1592 domain-containing protein [Alphaproteobacteria bacterium]
MPRHHLRRARWSQVAVGLLAVACATPEVEPSDKDSDTVDDTPVVDPGPAPVPEGVAPVLRRLSQTQYEHAIRDLVGDGVYVPAQIEVSQRIDGLDALGDATVALSPRGVSRFSDTAYSVAAEAMGPERRDGLVTCTPSAAVDAGCARTFLADFARRAWRRTLTADELDVLVDLSTSSAAVLEAELADGTPATEAFYEGLEYGVSAVLQAPDFLLRVELGEGGSYTGFEMASRLSFLLWDTIPDDLLLDAAEAGELDTPEGLDAQVERMIADPRAHDGLRAWVTDVLWLAHVSELQKDPSVFIQVSDDFFPSSVEETLRFVDHLVFGADADFRDLLTSRTTFLDRTLARVYDVRAPSREGFGLAELDPEGPRAGLLGQASILALYAHPTSTSATLRGKFVRQTLLCQTIRPPPSNVDTSIPEPTPDAPTLRDRLDSHLENPACSSCHLDMDPIGLGMEEFDGIGGFRETEAGADIDVTGDLDGAPFDGLAELGTTIRAHDDFVPCMVDQVTRYALGREIDAADADAVHWLEQRFAASGYRMKSLWVDLVTSPLYRRVAEVVP